MMGDEMNLKNDLIWFGLGVSGTILYQQVRNGNFRKMVRNMNKAKTKMLEDMENIM